MRQLWPLTWSMRESGVQHSQPLEDSSRILLPRDGQHILVLVAGDDHTKDEVDLPHVVYGEAIFQCFLEPLHSLLVPSSDDMSLTYILKIFMVSLMPCMRVHARVRRRWCEANSQQPIVNDIMSKVG